MSFAPDRISLEDLRLAVAIADHGSVARAASSLHMAQPSASQRLSALERRIGIALFDRSSAGSRATPAGAAFCEHAGRALDMVGRAGDAAREAIDRPRVTIGAIASLGPPVFAALDAFFEGRAMVTQRTDHGKYLVRQVADGILDAAVVALPAGLTAPRGTRRTRLGRDSLVLLVPAGVATPAQSGRQPLRGHTVIVSTYSTGPERIAERLTGRGASVRLATTAPTALAMARRRGCLAAVPGGASLADRRPEEVVRPLRGLPGVDVSWVTGLPWSGELAEAASVVSRALRLRPPSSPA